MFLVDFDLGSKARLVCSRRSIHHEAQRSESRRALLSQCSNETSLCYHHRPVSFSQSWLDMVVGENCAACYEPNPSDVAQSA